MILYDLLPMNALNFLRHESRQGAICAMGYMVAESMNLRSGVSAPKVIHPSFTYSN